MGVYTKVCFGYKRVVSNSAKNREFSNLTKEMKRIIKYLNRHGIFVIFPFLMYLFFREFLMNESTDLEKNTFRFFYFFFLIFSNFYFVVYHTEKIYEHRENSEGRFRFLAHTLGIIFFLSLTFASYYWCLFDYNKSNFTNVAEDNIYLDFLYYSFGVFLMNNTSEIQTNSFYAKLFVGTEMLTAFITLIMILANYKDLKSKTE